MMIVAAWFVYCLIFGAVLSAGAVAWEVAARWSGRQTRWAWLAALAGSVTLPFALRLIPEPVLGDVVPAAIPVVTLDPVFMTAPVSSGLSAFSVGLLAWAVLSVLAMVYLGFTMFQLARARRGWREAVVDGDRVWVTRNVGPAAVGLGRARVVIPAWALDLDAELRGLLLRHEGEHVRAGDPRMLMAGLVLVAAMPWNPVLWLQLLRLRNAIELDCDARVLSAGGDPVRYGSLLLEIGRRRGSNPLVMATFSEPRMFLEERIRRIARWPMERRPMRAVMFATLAFALFAATLSARDPMATAAAMQDIAAQDVVRELNRGMYLALEIDDATGLVYDGDGNLIGPRDQVFDAAGKLIAPRDIVVPSDTPPAVILRNMREQPRYTPMTKRPALLDVAASQQLLMRNYPPLLRDAGIGGTSVVWFFIGEDGKVIKTQLSKESGYAALDEAALAVASQMRFTSPMNGEEKVVAWVEIPIQFKVNSATGAIKVEGQRNPPPPPTPTSPRPTASDIPEMRVRPSLLNIDEVRAAMISSYPPLLKDAGITGAVVMWIYIDENGRPKKTQVAKESGHPALDQAALRVVGVMKFSPQLRGAEKVEGWVQFPFIFGDHANPTYDRPPGDVEVVEFEALGTVARPRPSATRTPTKDVPPPPPPRMPRSSQLDGANANVGTPQVQPSKEAGSPTFTPMTVRPELINISQVQQALVRAYPAELRDAGLGGMTTVWFYIDATGRVTKTMVSKESGYPTLDEAALKVAEVMRFAPALNGATKVPVWVEIPIQFKVN